MENPILDKRNKHFEGEIRKELSDKVEAGIELTETETKVLNHLNLLHEEEKFWALSRNR